MEPIRDPKFLARARAAFDLCETAEQMMRQNIRRWFPEESEDLIERRFRAWLYKDPDYSRTPFPEEPTNSVGEAPARRRSGHHG